MRTVAVGIAWTGGCGGVATAALAGIAAATDVRGATGTLDTGGGPGVGGGIAIGGMIGRDRGGVPAPTSTERLTTTVGVGLSLGEDGGAAGAAGAAGTGAALGATSLVVAALASLLSGTRFEKVLIEDF
jgi:hypothetical protein